MLNVGGGLIVSTQTQSCPGWSTYPIYPAFHGQDHFDATHLHHHQCSTMSLEKLLRYAQTTGELILAGRNLKEFPKHCFKYHLKDTTLADLSKNKLSELPQECTDYFLLERLILYNNSIRSIPDSIVSLQSLQFLDLSRNQLTYLPPSLCDLPLQALVLNNNKLVSLPEEIGKMQTLMELDASCNEIAHLPVQIGDLASLKSLNLRRNHLQELPVEISYLQLTFLDLSGNRISALPVELRFMTSVIELNLGENPLTCPPANLCSRGRVHVFKHLEIQAIKEDRKRGVLTESEYRRSYRKTTQLNDFRFASGFGADARRKRHTADSGYGSEQPLDRRWSQEFGHENGDISTTEEARRLILRAANCPRSPRGPNGINPVAIQPRASVSSCMPPPPIPPPHTSIVPPAYALPSSTPNHVTSAGSSSSSSSGYGSMQDHLIRNAPLSSPESSTSSSPTAITPDIYNGYTNKPPVKENAIRHSATQPELSNGTSNGHAMSSNQNDIKVQEDKPPNPNVPSDLDNPDDREKEERRRVAQKVLGKQGISLPGGNRTQRASPPIVAAVERRTIPDVKRSTSQRLQQNKTPICSDESTCIPACSKPQTSRHSLPLPAPPLYPKPQPSPQHHNMSTGSVGSLLPVPLGSNNPASNISNNNNKPLQQNQSYRQYREQLRMQRQNQTTPLSRMGYGGLNGSAPLINGSQDHLTAHELSMATNEKLHLNNSEVNGNNEVNIRHKAFDMKAMQKEAVLSYVKSKQGSPARSVTSSHSDYTSTRSYYQHHSTTVTNGRMASAPPSATTTTTSIPLPSNSSTSSASSVASSTNGLRYTGKLPISHNSAQKIIQPSVTFAARRDAEKSASADAHINQLRMQIETRLRISLPEDLSSALVDGVILCHIANHVRPRAVPSIHVPSPAVPKLTAAKCRRNVENFLLACRRIGVREEDLLIRDVEIDSTARFEPILVLRTILALISCADLQADLDVEQDFPDIIPRHASSSKTHNTFSTNIESIFLVLILLGTSIMLYLFPPSDP